MTTLGLPEVDGADAATAGVFSQEHVGKIALLNLLKTRQRTRNQAHEEFLTHLVHHVNGGWLGPLVWTLRDSERLTRGNLYSSSTTKKKKPQRNTCVYMSVMWLWSLGVSRVWQTVSKVRIYLKVEGRLFITAPSEAGRSQQAVDPVGDPTVKDEVSLNDPTLSVVHKDFSLFKKKKQPDQQAPSGVSSSSSASVSAGLTMSSSPPQVNESGEPCRVRTESR